MSSSSFKNKEKLVDASNFFPWKARLDITLEEHDALEYVEGEVAEPAEKSNVVIKARYKKDKSRLKILSLTLLATASSLMFLV